MNTNLEIKYVEVHIIKPYNKNPRIHLDKHIDEIVISINTFKFTNPILIDENNIISKKGDLWKLDKHIIYCGDSLEDESFHKLINEDRAQMIFTDAPYNVKITGHVCGNGKI